MMRALQIGLLTMALATNCLAATILVGPNERITRIADAARIARDGDTVLVSAGAYRGDVAVWRQKRLEIRSVGGRARLIADGADAEGKAIWVIRNGDFHIEGFEFTGARVASGNGAGIRFERGRLEIVDCYFHDNQMGLLTGNDPDAELRVRDSLFADAPRQQSPLPHLLYVGQIARLELSGSRFQNGYWGHLVKSRAQRSDIRYNLIADGPLGQASYEIDLPNGGEATLIGNVIEQNPRSENLTLVAFGAEGVTWPRARLVLSHNTFVNDGSDPASFIRLWPEKVAADAPVALLTRNNLTVGPGAPLSDTAGDHGGNQSLPTSTFADSAADFRVSLIERAPAGWTTIAMPISASISPDAEFRLPLGTRLLPPSQERLVGAIQSP